MEHFTACVTNIGRRANSLLRGRAKVHVKTGNKMMHYVGDPSTGENVNKGIEGDVENGSEEGASLQYFDGLDCQGSESEHEQSEAAFKAAWIDRFCAQDISLANKILHPLEKFWIAIARLNGFCGQLLGQAISVKHCHDSVRSWLCCLVVWGPVANFDKHLPVR